MHEDAGDGPGRTLRRRDFLTRVGMAGGAGALYTAMDALGVVASPTNAPAAHAAQTAFRPPRASDFGLRGRAAADVVIMGAGIAGLVTAHELLKAGYRCTIVEARDRPGGRNWTVRRGTTETELGGETQTADFADDIYFNAGPARLAGHMVTLDYCRELGVALEAFANQNADAYIFNENVGALSSTKIRHRTAKADVYGYISELLATATDRGALDAELTPADKERVIAFLQGFGAIAPKAGNFDYAGGPRRGYDVEPGAGTQPGVVRAPPPGLSEVFESLIGRSFSFELGYDQAMMMFQPVGGMDRIAYALAEAVERAGGRIVYGAEVQHLANTSEGVRVVVSRRGRIRELRGDYAVCTIPPTVLRKLSSNLAGPTKDAIAYPVGVSTGKIGLQYGRRFWEEDEKIFGGITNTNMDVSTIWYPSHGYLGARGLVVGYYNFGANAEKYGNVPHAERQAMAVAQGRKIHGDPYATELESSFSVAWQKIRYSEGGWMSWPSRTSGEYERLLAPDGRIYFAGDHLSYYIAWQAGAIESARLAVTALHDRVLAS